MGILDSEIDQRRKIKSLSDEELLDLELTLRTKTCSSVWEWDGNMMYRDKAIDEIYKRGTGMAIKCILVNRHKMWC